MHGTFKEHSGGQKRRADTKDRGMRSYRITCEDLGVRGQGFTCHATSMKGALAEWMRAADHDEAWPVAIGGKIVAVEVTGNGKPWRGTVSGTFIPRYEFKEAAE